MSTLADMTTPRSAAIYARISQDPGQTREGVQRQVTDALERISSLPETARCTLAGSPYDRKLPALGHWPEGVFVDNDISARSGSRKKRPEYDRLMASILGGDVQTVVCLAQARLWRNNAQRVQGLELLRDTDTALVFLKGQTIDLSRASDKLMVGVMGEFDAYEAEVTSERQRDATRHAAIAGAYAGARPFGFQLMHIDADGRGMHPSPKVLPDGSTAPCTVCGPGRKAARFRTLAPDPIEAPAVEEAYDLVRRGASPYQVCKYLDGFDIEDPDGSGATLNRKPVRTVSGRPWLDVGVSSLILVLRAPRNIGQRQHSPGWQGGKRPAGKLYEANWDAIIAEAVYRDVQVILDGLNGFRKGKGRAEPAHLLTGFAFCGVCGHRLRIHKIGGKRRYACDPYGGGGRSCVSREAESVEREVQRVLFEWLARNGQLTRALRMAGNADLQELLRKRDQHEVQKRQLADKHSDGVYDDDEYIRLRNRKAEMIAALDAEISEVVKKSAGVELPTGAEFRAQWKTASLDERRGIIRTFIDKIVIHPCGPGNEPDPLLVQVFPGAWAQGVEEAQPLPPPDYRTLTSRGRIEAFLREHPRRWYTRAEIAEGARVTPNEAHKNLRLLGAEGKAARQWRQRGGQAACFVYSAGNGTPWAPRVIESPVGGPARAAVLAYLTPRRSEWLTSREIVAGIGRPMPKTTERVLRDLTLDGFVKRRRASRPGAGQAGYEYTISGK